MVLLKFLFLIGIFEITVADEEPYFLSSEFIDEINAAQNTWIAGRNFDKNMSNEHVSQLLGACSFNTKSNLERVVYDPEVIADLPENFDPREKWPNCPSLNHIRNQGRCGSCWAHGVVESMTDRYCIKSNGTKQFTFSAQDMTSCGPYYNTGCGKGSAEGAFDYWVKYGIVSGGDYKSNEGCYPYELEPKHELPYLPTPECKHACRDGYNKSYQQDKIKGKRAYYLDTVEDMMADLYTNGPFVSLMKVYEDFLNYKHGIYRHIKGNFVSGHIVKTIGWGVENNVKYWLVSNSWGPGWGDKGFFKIIRGQNECYFEHGARCGEPLI